MVDTAVKTPPVAVDWTQPLPIVSCDGHIGPRMSDMRAYCPKDRLEEFDQFADQVDEMGKAFSSLRPEQTVDAPEALTRAAQSARMRWCGGALNCDARIRDMNSDGVVAEVIFHGVQDLGPVPWIASAGFTFSELVDTGSHELSILR